jgi:tetratricopeptide (TPR) repeat protein
LWAIKFQTANNFYFTLLTEAGMIGLAGVVLLLISVYRTIRVDLKEKKLVGWGFAGNASLLSLVAVLVLALFFPITLVPTVLIFILLSLNSSANKTSVNLSTQAAEDGSVGSKIPAFLVTLPVIAVIVAFGYYGVQVVRAESYFNRALTALAQNDGGRSYSLLQRAITTNPRVDRYRVSYSRVNLALANAITQQEEITEQDRASIGQLIQQAIRESKAAVALNLFRAGNWESLARTYQSIIPLANGAADFTVQTYRQAVALDPYNPNLRIALGGIYYAAGEYDTAVRVFEQAVAAKNDLPNAHYNLALALGQTGDFDQAIQEMTLVLSLVDRDSQDYQTAVDALDALQEQQKAEAGESANLTPPQEGEEPILQPPLDLPEESEPPETPISPTPTPTEEEAETTPTTTVSPTPTP